MRMIFNFVHITSKFWILYNTPQLVIWYNPRTKIKKKIRKYFIASKTLEKQSFLEVSVNKKKKILL